MRPPALAMPRTTPADTPARSATVLARAGHGPPRLSMASRAGLMRAGGWPEGRKWVAVAEASSALCERSTCRSTMPGEATL